MPFVLGFCWPICVPNFKGWNCLLNPKGGRLPFESDTMIVFQNYPFFPLPPRSGVKQIFCPLNRRMVSLKQCKFYVYFFFMFPLWIAFEPHCVLNPSSGSVCSRGCGIGCQAKLRWLSPWLTIATGTSTPSRPLFSPCKCNPQPDPQNPCTCARFLAI